MEMCIPQRVSRTVVRVALALVPCIGHSDAEIQLSLIKMDITNFPVISCSLTANDLAGETANHLVAPDWSLTEDDSLVTSIICQPMRTGGERVAVAIAIDTSGSIRSAELSRARQALVELVHRLGPGDHCSVVTFSGRPTIVGEFHGGTRIDDGLGDVTVGGNTALYDTLVFAADLLNRQDADRKAVVVLTDGRDTASGRGLDAAEAAMREGGCVLHLVGLGPEPDETTMRAMASSTGGSYYPTADAAAVIGVLRSMLSGIRTYYTLSYQASTSPSTNTLRSVVVSLAEDREVSTSGQYSVPHGRAVSAYPTSAGELPGGLTGMLLLLVVVNALMIILVLRGRRGRSI